MGVPCIHCCKVCEDTFAECVENDWHARETRIEEDIRRALEERHPGAWTRARLIDDLTDERSREPEWTDRKVREWKSQS